MTIPKLVHRKIIWLLMVLAVAQGQMTNADEPDLPPSADMAVNFSTHIKPILMQHCSTCHTGTERKGGLSMNTREGLLSGSEYDIVVRVGNSGESPLIDRVASSDLSFRMPPEGEPSLTAAQISLLRAWVDQGLTWEDGFAFGQLYRQARLEPRNVLLPTVPGVSHPVDRLLHPYFKKHRVVRNTVVDDGVFARRVWLDIIGLLPPVDELQSFVEDPRADKYDRLVDRLLNDNGEYAAHWLTYWNDMLRNAYRGPGYIDGGRQQITTWLYNALYDNMPFDQFVSELVTEANGADGFIKGIKWRGTVNDSQRREMQAAQSISQVFLGTNLKCASCHDSFVNHWKLKDAYAFASVFADQPLELHRCDRPTGVPSTIAFIYPQLGDIDPTASRNRRLKQLAEMMTHPNNGRLARTIVNRLWAHFFGAGIVEPLDDMDVEPFDQDLLDGLAYDLATHGYDLKYTIRQICTSNAYRMQAKGAPLPTEKKTAFQGPIVKRMSAEQFIDAVSTLTGISSRASASMQPLARRSQGSEGARRRGNPPSEIRHRGIRAALADTDSLARALGRPSRDQVVTRRESIATTLQALELTNGTTLDAKLRRGAQRWHERLGNDPNQLSQQIYRTALGRSPVQAELEATLELLGTAPDVQKIQDMLWALVMHPEFQLIY